MNAIQIALVAGGICAVAAAQTAPAPGASTMKPKFQQAGTGAFQAEHPALLVGRSLQANGAPAVAPLVARLGSATTEAEPSSRPLPSEPFVLVGLGRDNPELRALIRANQGRLQERSLGDEGFTIDVTPARILVAAEKPAGAFYGVCKLLEMSGAEAGLSVPAGTVADRPTMRWRGIHLYMSSRTDLPSIELLITKYMPQLRLNRLILQVDYHYQYRSHPEMSDANGLTTDDCRRLRDLADRSFVKITPMIDCLGHQSGGSTTGRLLTAHPEFDETPDYPADNKGIYCRSWCASNPVVYRLVDDLMDELIDAFHADSFHVGMDEVFILGKCPRCRGTDTAHLFAGAVNALHDHLVGKRKVTMMMWGDRFLDGRATGYGEWEASENGTEAAIDMVPKDIVMCDWHYELRYNNAPATYPSVQYFQQRGFRVWPSGWNSVQNAQMLATQSLAGATDRMVGYLATTWQSIPSVLNGIAAPPGAVSQPARGRRRGDLGGAIREGARIAWEGAGTAS